MRMIMIVLTIVIPLWLIGIFLIVREWKRDCKEIGRENLAVSLWERLRAFAICFVIPVIVGLLMSVK